MRAVLGRIEHLSTCRVCGKSEIDGDMIKYGVRHYAHPACGLKRWGAGFFDRLKDWQLAN